MKLDYRSRTFKLVITALMLALATVLSEMTPIRMPMGGTVTPGSMVPLVLIGQMYGVGWGLGACTVYGLTQMLFGIDNFSYATTLWAVLAIALFDYLVAYGIIGLSGVTRKIKNRPLAAGLAGLIAGVGRFLCHFLSGVTVWKEWVDVTALPTSLQDTWLAKGDALIYSYSFFYNGATMLPETIVTVVLSALVWGALSAGLKINPAEEKKLGAEVQD
ncbi:MAG: hypothetical protein E7554_07810 [Ruminococcaceae bacterium]|nr:hypothetical protein [Oscillospiraceae bacterium]